MFIIANNESWKEISKYQFNSAVNNGLEFVVMEFDRNINKAHKSFRVD